MEKIPGILGKKLGMSQVFSEDGQVIPVTAIQAGPCVVTQVKTRENDGYSAVQLGFGEAKRLNKPLRGHLKNLGSFKYLREVRVDDPSDIKLGNVVNVSIFQPGEKVLVTGTSKGKGFAGVVKRYGFAGGPKSHGQSDRHRAPGSIGAGTDPGRVIKGLRMAGHLGSRRVTVRNLEVVKADPEANLLLVKGAIPGARNSLLLIRKAKSS